MESQSIATYLPSEMIAYTCQFMPFEGLCSLSGTCKGWYHYTWGLKEVSDVKISQLVWGILNHETKADIKTFFPKSLPMLTSIDLPGIELTQEVGSLIFKLAKTTTALTHLRYKGVNLDAICCHDFYFRHDPSYQHDFNTLSGILSSNLKLQVLQAPGIYQPPLDLLENTLSSSKVQYLDLSGLWQLPSSLAAAISRMSELEIVILNGCQFEAEDIDQFHSVFLSDRIRFLSLQRSRFKGASKIPALKAPLELKINALNMDKMECPIPSYQEAFIEALTTPSCLLESLTLPLDTFQKFERIRKFFQAMENNLSVRRLKITDVSIGENIVVCLSEFLKANKTCEEMVFPNIYMRNPAQFIEALCQEIHLSRLTIKTDRISARDLVRILSENTSLRYLFIESYTVIGEDARPGAVGIAQILEALQKNTTLDQLVIKQVTQTPFGIRAEKNFDPVIERFDLQDRIRVI